MKLKVFNRTKFESNLRKLKNRKAPSYVLESYFLGYTDVLNLYYKNKLNKKIGQEPILRESIEDKKILKLAKESRNPIIREAVKKLDMDFIKAFYQMTNLDIFTGKGNKIAPNMSSLLKQKPTSGIGLTDITKKMR